MLSRARTPARSASPSVAMARVRSGSVVAGGVLALAPPARERESVPRTASTSNQTSQKSELFTRRPGARSPSPAARRAATKLATLTKKNASIERCTTTASLFCRGPKSA